MPSDTNVAAAGSLPANSLTPEGCQLRQGRLRQLLHDLELDAALLTDPTHVWWLTNYWRWPWWSRPAVLVRADGAVTLATGFDPLDESPIVADRVAKFEGNRCATLIDDQAGGSLNALQESLVGVKRIGVDESPRPSRLGNVAVESINDGLWRLRRWKDDDEVAVIRRCIAGTDAAYARAKELLKPGVTEIEMFAELQAAAIKAVGEEIGPFGNDFAAGKLGGPPTSRPMQAGELVIYDLGVVVRGHNADNCRTFAVDGKPTDLQLEAWALVKQALDHCEKVIKPGKSCLELYAEVESILESNPHGWTFGHHLGHGIGLRPHERPRLNPHYDDHFEAGDVITTEPGIYGDALRGGIRLEHNWRVTDTGVDLLTPFPIDLV